MIKFEKTEVVGWEHAIRGMRNALESWDKMDSKWSCIKPSEEHMTVYCVDDYEFYIGPNDQKLMMKLRKAGPDHRKFMRMIVVYVDITAPLYWWKEFDTYKVGTVANSCSTMHKIHAKKFTLDDFSHERLDGVSRDMFGNGDGTKFFCSFEDMLYTQIEALNEARRLYLETKDKSYWWQMIQLLSSSYNQKRTVMLNYEVLANIYKSRKNHKLDEWKEHDYSSKEDLSYENTFEKHAGFCDWIRILPYSELITGKEGE